MFYFDVVFASSARNESHYYAGDEALSSSASSDESSAQLLDEGSLLFSEMNRFVHDENGTCIFLFFPPLDILYLATRLEGS